MLIPKCLQLHASFPLTQRLAQIAILACCSATGEGIQSNSSTKLHPRLEGVYADGDRPRHPQSGAPTSCRESRSGVLPAAALWLKKKRAEGMLPRSLTAVLSRNGCFHSPSTPSVHKILTIFLSLVAHLFFFSLSHLHHSKS